MAHFARIENGVISNVIVIANEVLLDENGQEQESIGAAFCKDLLGGEWVQTSYNGTFRDKFATNGDTWNGVSFARQPASGEVV